MKKILVILICLCMLLSVVACKKTPPTQGTTELPETTPTPEESQIPEQPQKTYQEVYADIISQYTTLLIAKQRGETLVAPNTDGMDVKFRGTFGDYENENKRSRFQSTYSETEHIDVNATIAYSASTMVADIKMLFASASGISEVTIGGNVKVFPNPATEVIYIENEAAKAQLFSLAGQQVFEGENVSSIDVKDMPAGIYMLRTTDAEGNIASTKIVKK
jgi:hypothetical protein